MSKFDLCLTVADTVQGLEGALAYSASLFDPETVAGLLRHFETLLGSIVADPEARLDELEILSPAEREQLEAEKRRRRETNIKRFKSTQPRAVGAGRRQLVKTDFLDPDKLLPLVIEPNLRDVDFFDWVSNNRDLIESSLLKHGAALFRGFGLNARADLEQFLKAYSLPLMKYVEGAAPRTESKNGVYTSTEDPSDQSIALHHELAHVLSWPMKICFFCEQPASGGGETSIADVRNVLRCLSPRIVERFAGKGWMLVRNFREGSSLSWQKSFQLTSHTEAQDYFRRAQIDWEWKNDGRDLTTRQVRSAVTRHPSTGEMVWFNHVAFWHASSLEPHVRKDLPASMKESELPHNTYYGDGSSIEDSVVEEIRAAYRQETAVFTWRAGDLLVLDNMLAAHGRNWCCASSISIPVSSSSLRPECACAWSESCGAVSLARR
jgi:alpha-ketoglutarate-dependent taurine dioxygenase